MRRQGGSDRLDHDEVHVVHALLAEVELVVEDLVEHGVAVALPHPPQHLPCHDNAPERLLKQLQQELRLPREEGRGGEGRGGEGRGGEGRGGKGREGEGRGGEGRGGEGRGGEGRGGKGREGEIRYHTVV